MKNRKKLVVSMRRMSALYFSFVLLPCYSVLAAQTTTYTQLVVFVEMADTYFEGSLEPCISTLIGEDENASSFDNYFNEVSYGKVNFNFFIPRHDNGTPVVVKLPYTYAQIRGYDEILNPEGDKDVGLIGYYSLNKMASWILPQIIDKIPDTIDFDVDNDGYVDFISFYVAAKSFYMNDWWYTSPSFAASVNDSSIPKINGKTPFLVAFNNISSEAGQDNVKAFIDLGVACHETMHNLGISEYYSYDGDWDTQHGSIGAWDVMSWGNTNPPSHLSSHLKEQLGWITIPEITEPGRYTLNPLSFPTGENVAYKIRTNASPDGEEYLVVEYRRKMGDNKPDAHIYGSGLVIYRVNTRFNGNFSVSDIELYVYRKGEANTVSSLMSGSFFSADVGRTIFAPGFEYYPFLSDGTKIDDIFITHISEAGNTISFDFSRTLPTSIDNPSIANWSVQYQSATDELFVEGIIPMEIEIFSTEGMRLIRKENSSVINLSNIPSGIYLVVIVEQGKKHTYKFVK